MAPLEGMCHVDLPRGSSLAYVLYPPARPREETSVQIESKPELRPYGSKIMVKPLSGKILRIGSFDVPDTVAGQLTPQQGVVLGRGFRVEKVSEGSRVLFGHGVGAEISWCGEELLFINEGDVICELD